MLHLFFFKLNKLFIEFKNIATKKTERARERIYAYRSNTPFAIVLCNFKYKLKSKTYAENQRIIYINIKVNEQMQKKK